MGGEGNDLRRQVLGFVGGFLQENGYAPTYDEIRSSVGLSSKSHVVYYLTLLESEGLIERTPRSPRSLRLKRPEGSSG